MDRIASGSNFNVYGSSVSPAVSVSQSYLLAFPVLAFAATVSSQDANQLVLVFSVAVTHAGQSTASAMNLLLDRSIIGMELHVLVYDHV